VISGHRQGKVPQVSSSGVGCSCDEAVLLVIKQAITTLTSKRAVSLWARDETCGC
jgi:hypothetical protein